MNPNWPHRFPYQYVRVRNDFPPFDTYPASNPGPNEKATQHEVYTCDESAQTDLSVRDKYMGNPDDLITAAYENWFAQVGDIRVPYEYLKKMRHLFTPDMVEHFINDRFESYSAAFEMLITHFGLRLHLDGIPIPCASTSTCTAPLEEICQILRPIS